MLLTAYLGLVLTALLRLIDWFGGSQASVEHPLMHLLLTGSALCLVWRLAMRSAFVTATYGWGEGLRAIPRATVSNIIAMMAARRAVFVYLKMRRDGVVRWDKTTHAFPAIVPAE